MIKVNITSNEPYQHSVSHSMILRTQHTSVVYISRIPNFSFIIAKHQSNSNWETFYKITTYQNVTKKCQHNGTQEQIEKLSRWKKKFNTAIISSVKSCIGSWDRKKRHQWRNWQYSNMGSKCRKRCYFNVNFLILIVIQGLCKLLILGEV